MKKTIIALLALGTCAMGVTLEDAIKKGNGSDTVTLDTATSTITAVATVDVNSLKAVMLAGADLGKYTLIDFIDEDTNDIGLQTNYTSSANKIATSGLYGIWNQGGAYKIGLETDKGYNFHTETFWSNAAAAAVTLTYSYNTGTTATFTLLDEKGNKLKELGGDWNTGLKGSTSSFDYVDFDDMVTGSYVFNQVVTVEDAKALSYAAAKAALPTVSVPEPTTATLSLLALAGLAARRRRR